jgi:hypothetical protein
MVAALHNSTKIFVATIAELRWLAGGGSATYLTE